MVRLTDCHSSMRVIFFIFHIHLVDSYLIVTIKEILKNFLFNFSNRYQQGIIRQFLRINWVIFSFTVVVNSLCSFATNRTSFKTVWVLHSMVSLFNYTEQTLR